MPSICHQLVMIQSLSPTSYPLPWQPGGLGPAQAWLEQKPGTRSALHDSAATSPHLLSSALAACLAALCSALAAAVAALRSSLRSAFSCSFSSHRSICSSRARHHQSTSPVHLSKLLHLPTSKYSVSGPPDPPEAAQEMGTTGKGIWTIQYGMFLHGG